MRVAWTPKDCLAFHSQYSYKQTSTNGWSCYPSVGCLPISEKHKKRGISSQSIQFRDLLLNAWRTLVLATGFVQFYLVFPNNFPLRNSYLVNPVIEQRQRSVPLPVH